MKKLCVRVLPVLATLLLVQGCANTAALRRPEERPLLVLRNDRIVVGLLPAVGGRIVLLRRPGGENVLKADPALWGLPAGSHPTPGIEGGWRPYWGQIVWVGPQSAWWTEQDVDPVRKQKKSDWPPDPYLVYGSFGIAERRADYVRLEGPVSPISGVQLTKEVRIDRDGRVRFSVTARNTRAAVLQRDLWPNARMDGFSRVYVPVAAASDVRVSGPKPGHPKRVQMAHAVTDGFFTFTPAAPPAGKLWRTAKAYVQPSRGLLAGFSARDLFLIQFALVDRAQVHPDQGHVELYNHARREGDRVESLLELETHGPLEELEPGAGMTLEQTWRVIEYTGPCNAQAHVHFLNAVLATGVARDFE